jgi:hypothetical protein
MVNVEWTNHIPSLSSFFMTASVGMSSWQNCQFLCRRICPTPLFVKQIFTRIRGSCRVPLSWYYSQRGTPKRRNNAKTNCVRSYQKHRWGHNLFSAAL